MPKDTIYFISETVPANTHASSVVFYRHFKRLEQDGYHIVWITDRNSYYRFKDRFPSEWDFILLPNRKWILPPYQASGMLQAYRFYYYYQLLPKHITAGSSRSILMTYINGQFLAPFAAYIKQKSKLPLLSFFHDDILELNYFKNMKSLIRNTNSVLEASERVLVASNELAACWAPFKEKFQLLYPIPEKYTAPANAPKPNGPLTFGYSGAVYDEIIPCLGMLAEAFETLGFKLLVIGDRDKTVSLQKQYPVVVSCYGLFGTPEESNNFLVKNCHAVLIPYPEHIKEMPWIATCFPSKFLQYCQLGLPALIIAPEASAIGKWSRVNKWPLYSNEYNIDKIAELSHQIADEATRIQINSLKQNEFDPDKIHGQLADTIKRSLCND